MLRRLYCVPCCAVPIQVDTFFFKAPDVGTFNSLRIGHNNKGFGAAWHLAKVRHRGGCTLACSGHGGKPLSFVDTDARAFP